MKCEHYKPNNIPTDISINNMLYSWKFTNVKNFENQLHLCISKIIFSKNNSSLVVTESDPSGIGISIFKNDSEDSCVTSFSIDAVVRDHHIYKEV